MSKGRADIDVTPSPARRRSGYSPLGMFLVGCVFTGVLTAGVLHFTGGVTRAEPASAAAQTATAISTPAPKRPATKPAERYSATAKFVYFQPPAEGKEVNISNAAREAKLRDELAGAKSIAELAEALKLLDEAPRDEAGRLTPVGKTLKQLTVAKLMAGITVDRQGDLVSVTATHDDPATAQRIANTLVTSYLRRVSNSIEKRLAVVSESVTGKITEGQSRLGELLKAKRDIETKHADAMPDKLGPLKDRIAVLTTGVLAQRLRQTTAAASLTILKGKLKPASKPGKRPNPARIPLAKQLETAEKKLKAIRKGKTDRHPSIISQQAKIDELTKRLSAIPAEVEIPARGEAERSALLARIAAAEAELAAATRETEQLNTRLRPLTKLFASFAPIHRQHAEIVEKIKTEQEGLDIWQKRYAAVQTDQAAEVAKLRTRLNAAQAARKPSQPDPSPPSLEAKGAPPPVVKAVRAEPTRPLHVMLAIAAAAGAAGGLILAMMALWLNRSSRRAIAPSH